MYSYLVPEMILEKFHEKWMLGSAKTKGPPLSLTTSVKVANPFPEAGSSPPFSVPYVRAYKTEHMHCKNLAQSQNCFIRFLHRQANRFL